MELQRLLGSPRAWVAVVQNQLDEIKRRLKLVHEEPSTLSNDDEYLRLVTDKHAVEKRLEYATSQLLAEEEQENKVGEKQVKLKEEEDQ